MIKFNLLQAIVKILIRKSDFKWPIKFLKNQLYCLIKNKLKFLYLIQNILFEKITELIYDCEIRVKIAAIKLIFKIFKLLP